MPSPDAGFTLLEDDEPRGEPYGEPRPDDLRLDKTEECWRNADGKPVCGATPSTKDWEYDRCKNTAVLENGRCRHHGGLTPKGKEHGAYKHGKFSKSLPDSAREKYEKARGDKQLTNLREEIAVIESRIHLTLEALEVEDSGELWDNLKDAVGRLRDAQNAGNTGEAAQALQQISRLVDVGSTDQERWSEVQSLIEQKRKLVDSERRREKALRAYVPIDEFKVQMEALNEVLRQHIEDRKKLQDIFRELEQTLGLGR